MVPPRGACASLAWAKAAPAVLCTLSNGCGGILTHTPYTEKFGNQFKQKLSRSQTNLFCAYSLRLICWFWATISRRVHEIYEKEKWLRAGATQLSFNQIINVALTVIELGWRCVECSAAWLKWAVAMNLLPHILAWRSPGSVVNDSSNLLVVYLLTISVHPTQCDDSYNEVERISLYLQNVLLIGKFLIGGNKNNKQFVAWVHARKKQFEWNRVTTSNR